jgi:hypothetical protein
LDSTAPSSDDEDNNDDGNHAAIRHYSYVPTVSLRIKQPPSVSSLINLKQRYYYNYKTEGKEQQTDPIIDLESFSTTDMSSTILQGLILQMKGSRLSKSYMQGDGTNQASSKESGLNSYCEYLRGNEIENKKQIKKLNQQ